MMLVNPPNANDRVHQLERVIKYLVWLHAVEALFLLLIVLFIVNAK